MECREDLKSVLPFLPLLLRSSTLFWPSQVVETLKAMAEGPIRSGVDSGRTLFHSISNLRQSLSLSAQPLASSAPDGYAFFFQELMTGLESVKWFDEVVPALASLLFRLPSLLETHYRDADNLISEGRHKVKTGLRMLGSQESGIVLLSQELIGALLACAFFCLLPVTDRVSEKLPAINFDKLFAILYDRYSQKQESKIRCIVHYFSRICANMPRGFVSFERKVLSQGHCQNDMCYPNASFWSDSVIPLCQFEVLGSGLIEDHLLGALEVDFANKYIGGGALLSGCVQEEIRFMISPELIAGMLFLPSMEDNEAIEIVGAERYSNYTGYASTFRFTGDYVDTQELDLLRRRKTMIVAIDALCSPGKRQYKQELLLREINKAFCGFFYQSKFRRYESLFGGDGCSGIDRRQDVTYPCEMSGNDPLLNKVTSTAVENFEERSVNYAIGDSEEKDPQFLDQEGNFGIVTGNWGCGAFGGDPELKSVIQWLAASQALRPSISFYTFGIEALQNLEQVTEWIQSHEWTVGDLWDMLVEYSTQRLNGETNVGFFTWLLPSLPFNTES